MKRLCSVFLVSILMSPIGFTLADDFPKAPPNINAAEAKGLVRLTADELKGYFPGVIESRQEKGVKTFVHNPDGSLEMKGFKDKPGKWRIDGKKDTYCRTLHRKKGYEEHCFAVFKAPDGIYHYDYDIQDGLRVHVWRRAAEQ